MSGYAVSAQIRSATPRIASSGMLGWPEPGTGGHGRQSPADALIVTLDPDDAVPPPEPTAAERWEAIRERWGQLTFYLFDADSWR